jgi:hypothetical protein
MPLIMNLHVVGSRTGLEGASCSFQSEKNLSKFPEADLKSAEVSDPPSGRKDL